jgi:hypothetical protein
MVWTNVNLIEEKLKNEELSDRDSFKYLILLIIFLPLFFFEDNERYTNRDYEIAEELISFILIIGTLLIAYSNNYRHGNRNFFIKLFSISFVTFANLALKGLFLLFPAMLILLFVSITLGIGEVVSENRDLISFIIFVSLYSIYSIIILKSFHKVNKQIISKKSELFDFKDIKSKLKIMKVYFSGIALVFLSLLGSGVLIEFIINIDKYEKSAKDAGERGSRDALEDVKRMDENIKSQFQKRKQENKEM